MPQRRAQAPGASLPASPARRDRAQATACSMRSQLRSKPAISPRTWTRNWPPRRPCGKQAAARGACRGLLGTGYKQTGTQRGITPKRSPGRAAFPFMIATATGSRMIHGISWVWRCAAGARRVGSFTIKHATGADPCLNAGSPGHGMRGQFVFFSGAPAGRPAEAPIVCYFASWAVARPAEKRSLLLRSEAFCCEGIGAPGREATLYLVRVAGKT